MSNVTKLIISVVGFLLIGFFIVGTSEKSEEEKKNDAFVSGYGAMSSMASKKCPQAIKKHTGSPVFFPSKTDSDKQTYIVLTWEGGKNDKFKTAVCRFERSRGGIAELIIDGKAVIDR